MTFVRRGGRKVIVAPDGGDAWAPSRPRPDVALIRAIVRAHRWKRMLEERRYRSAGELAEAERVTRSFVTRPAVSSRLPCHLPVRCPHPSARHVRWRD
jgi:hypothetical protein